MLSKLIIPLAGPIHPSLQNDPIGHCLPTPFLVEQGRGSDSKDP